MALVKCIECKKKIASTAEKCPHCGFDSPTIKRKRCKKCKEECLSTIAFCIHCGIKKPGITLANQIISSVITMWRKKSRDYTSKSDNF